MCQSVCICLSLGSILYVFREYSQVLQPPHTPHLLYHLKYFKLSVTGTAPQYLAEPVHIYVPSRSLCSSSDDRTFVSPPSREKSMVVGPSVSLLQKPGIISLPSSALALLSLPSRLIKKTPHLFKQYFD